MEELLMPPSTLIVFSANTFTSPNPAVTMFEENVQPKVLEFLGGDVIPAPCQTHMNLTSLL